MSQTNSANTAKTLQEQVTRVSQAQLEYFQDHQQFTDDIDRLRDYDENIDGGQMQLNGTEIPTTQISVTGEGKNSFFTTTAYWRYSGNTLETKNGFAIQGNTNGVIATCDSRYDFDCNNSIWTIKPVEVDQNSKFPINPNGSTAKGIELQQLPEPAASCPQNPYGPNQLPFTECSK